MGKQLDSLADVVSFGVAPGLIMYQMLRLSFAYEPDGLETPLYNLLPALLLPAATAWRLARFNIDPGQKYGFKGVPAPAAGLVIASIPLIALYNYFGVQEYLLNKWVLYVIIAVVSYLMVSTLPLMGLKFTNYSLKQNWTRFLLVGAGIVSALLFQWMAVPVVFILYILLSLLTQNKTA
jgi:CDP-diacylglycerol--serine O-phosphatidyltransferase